MEVSIKSAFVSGSFNCYSLKNYFRKNGAESTARRPTVLAVM